MCDPVFVGYRNLEIKPNLSIHVGNVLHAESHQRVDCVDETVCRGGVWGRRWVRRAGTVRGWVAGASTLTTHRKKGLLNPFPSLSACPQPVRRHQSHTLEASSCIHLPSIKNNKTYIGFAKTSYTTLARLNFRQIIKEAVKIKLLIQA